MAKSKIKKGAKLTCIPCGREVVISNCGISRATIWCCGTPMKKGKVAAKKTKKTK